MYDEDERNQNAADRHIATISPGNRADAERYLTRAGVVGRNRPNTIRRKAGWLLELN